MRAAVVVLALAACNIPDAHFFKGDGGTGGDAGGGDARHCLHGIGYPSAPWPVVGPGVTAYALGDIDGDHFTDLVFAIGSELHVLHGKGDGSFTASNTQKLSQPVSAIALAQVDGSNTPDIITLSHDASTVTVVLVDSTTHELIPQSPVATGTGPIAIALAHITAGNKLDILTLDATSRTVSVLPGSGTGAFGPRSYFSLDDTPTAFAVGDFDGQYHDDVAVTTTTGSGPDTLHLLLDTADGTLNEAKTKYDVGLGATAVATGDFNGDDKRDVAVVRSSDASVAVLYGDGTGALPSRGTPADLGGGRAAATAQINADALDDLVVITSDGLHVLSGTATGFAETASAFGGNVPAGVAVDLVTQPDSNGRTTQPNLIATSNPMDGTFSVWLARVDGTLIAPTVYAVGDTPTSALVAPWITGAPPVILVSNTNASLSIVRPGTEQVPRTVDVGPAATQPGPAAALDLDGDKKLDLAVTDQGNPTLHLLRGAGDGTSAGESTLTLPSPGRAIAAGDLDGDGKVDLVVADTTAHKLTFVTNNGTTSPAHDDLALDTDAEPVGVAIFPTGIANQTTIAIADHADRRLTLLIHMPAGGYQKASQPVVDSGAPPGVAAAPLHAGGAPDLVATVDGAMPMIYVYRYNGSAFLTPEQHAAGPMPQSPRIVDLDNDGNPDIVYSVRNGSTIGVLYGKPDGTLANEVEYGVGPGPGNFDVTDVTGDGVPDLIVPHGSDSLSVLPASCL